MKFVILIAVALVFGQFVFGDPQFEIIEGNCTGVTDKDITWSQEDYKVAIPFITREGTLRYSGLKTIYCLSALSQKDKSSNSTVEIMNGGVNQTYVEFEMKSAKSHGYDYVLTVYAE